VFRGESGRLRLSCSPTGHGNRVGATSAATLAGLVTSGQRGFAREVQKNARRNPRQFAWSDARTVPQAGRVTLVRDSTSRKIKACGGEQGLGPRPKVQARGPIQDQNQRAPAAASQVYSEIPEHLENAKRTLRTPATSKVSRVRPSQHENSESTNAKAGPGRTGATQNTKSGLTEGTFPAEAVGHEEGHSDI
jgi:hypothetical protein